MEAGDKQRSLLNRLQKALGDAIMLITEEQEHHALCYRSISMMQPYAQMIPSFHKTHAIHYTDEQKSGLIRWLEWVKLTLVSASQEEISDFQRVKRRSVIVLADVLEAAVEVVIATCLQHLDPAAASVRELTKYRKDIIDDAGSKLAVRSWERLLFLDYRLRSDRFTYMIRCFFPAFQPPQDIQLIDLLVENRNRLTHDIISLSRYVEPDTDCPTFSAEQIDSFFSASGDFLLALLKAMPGKLPDLIPVLDARYRSASES